MVTPTSTGGPEIRISGFLGSWSYNENNKCLLFIVILTVFGLLMMVYEYSSWWWFCKCALHSVETRILRMQSVYYGICKYIMKPRCDLTLRYTQLPNLVHSTQTCIKC